MSEAIEASSPEDVVEEEVTLHVSRIVGQGLGISIAGGKGSTPYKGNDESVFISRVAESGPAALCGVCVGDKLISVNGFNLVDADHYEAVEVLKNSGYDIILVVAREQPVSRPENNVAEEEFDNTGIATVSFTEEPEMEVYGETISTSLIRDQNGLGFSIAGGRGSTPFKANDHAIYISRIVDGAAAHRDGKLFVGDRIISINGVDMQDARHDQAVALLTGFDKEIKLVVYRERLVPKGANTSMESTGSSVQKIAHMTQPRITWATQTTADKSPQPVTSIFNNQPNVSTESSGFITEVPTTAPHLLKPSVTTTSVTTNLQTSPGLQTIRNQSHSPNISSACTSPSFRTLSSDWTTPPPTIQPPRFHYPGFNKSPTVTTKSTTNEQKESIMQARSSPVGISQSPYKSNVDSKASIGSVNTRSPATSVSGNSSIPLLASCDRLPRGSLNHEESHAYPVEVPDSDLDRPGTWPPAILKMAVASHDSGPPQQEITFGRHGGPLGLSIVGGTDHSSFPFGTDNPGIFVSKIEKDGIAATTNLKFGDRILSVNGKNITQATHQDAVMVLINPCNQMTLEVQHEPPLPGLKEYSISKGPGEKLGMSIRGGALSYADNTMDRTDDGIFISNIASDGAVARHGELNVGRRILEVNNQSLLGASHAEAVRALRSVGDQMLILVCNGYPEEKPLADFTPSPITPVIYKPRSSSISSINKEDEDSIAIQQEQEALREMKEFEEEDMKKLQLHEQQVSLDQSMNEQESFNQSMDKQVSSNQSIDGQVSSNESINEQVSLSLSMNEIVEEIIPEVKSVTLETAPVTLQMPDIGPTLQMKPPPPKPEPVPELLQEIISPNEDNVHIQVAETMASPEETLTPTAQAKRRPGPKPPVPAKRKSLTLQSKSLAVTSTDLPFPDQVISPPESIIPPSTATSPNQIPPVQKATSPDTTALSPSTLPAIETEFIDSIKQSKQPSGLLPQVRSSQNPTEGMSFTEKRKYFEREIQHQATGGPRIKTKQFSYLADHEVARMRQEEEQKASNMSHEELLEYMSPDQETEFNQVLASKIVPQACSVRTLKAEKRLMVQQQSNPYNEEPTGEKIALADERAREAEKRAAWRKARMKSLEEDTQKAKAVIERANELSQNMSFEEVKQKVNQFSTVDIAFADADSSEESGTTHNGESSHMSSTHHSETPLSDRGILRGQLTLHKEEGDTTVRKSTQMIDQKVSECTEEVFDENLGKPVLKTFKIIVKTLEHEVEVTKKQIYELKLEDGESGPRLSNNDSRR